MPPGQPEFVTRPLGEEGETLAALGARKSVFKRHLFTTCDFHEIVVNPKINKTNNDSPGCSRGTLGRSWAALARSWGALGRSWAALVRS